MTTLLPRDPGRPTLARGPLLVLLGLLPAAGCVLDSGLNGADKEPRFDTGEPADSLDTDTDPPGETAETAAPATCEDASYPAEEVPTVDTCGGEPPEVSFTPVIEWTNTDPGPSATTPVVGQLTDDDGDGDADDDDTPDIVVTNWSGTTYALSGDGTTLWSVLTIASSTAAIGDLDGDGFPEVVLPAWGGTLALHGEDGSTYWEGEGDPNLGAAGAVSIADLDADGDPEVVFANLILDGQDGSLRGRGTHGTGSGYPTGIRGGMGVAADIDRDGVLEVVVGNALYDPDGNTVWYNGESDGYVAVADFDGDPEGEIVVVPTGGLRLQDDDGTVLWSQSPVGDMGGPPTVADFDGDGDPEIGVAGRSLYVVLEADGTELWSRAIDDSTSGFTGSSAFDFDGDGAFEVVYADENDVWVFDGRTGAVLLQEGTHASATGSEYPTVADVDGDGHAEIVYTSNAFERGTENGVRVLGDDSWPPGRKVWNQYAYTITNVEDDGRIPTVPDVNWDSYNNFRAGVSTTPAGEPGADLYPHLHAVCADECAEGRLTVWLSVANQGLADVTDAFDVEVWGATDTGTVLLHTLPWTGGVPAGTRSASVAVELTLPGPIHGLTITVDAGGAIEECDEANDTIEQDEPYCG